MHEFSKIIWAKVKCKLPRLRLELESWSPFPARINYAIVIIIIMSWRQRGYP